MLLETSVCLVANGKGADGFATGFSHAGISGVAGLCQYLTVPLENTSGRWTLKDNHPATLMATPAADDGHPAALTATRPR